MKTRFSTIDVRAVVNEIRTRLLNLRVVNVYDIDHKTYLIKLSKSDEKAVLLFEAGVRLHQTEFDWPKSDVPSGFSMKLRKHIRGRRLEAICQLGIDRIVNLQFGANEAAYHVIVELYDRGNVVLTDHEYTILNVLRPRTDEETDVKFVVREKYPLSQAREHKGLISEEKLQSVLTDATEGTNLKKYLNPVLPYGPALLDHSMYELGQGSSNIRIGKDFSPVDDLSKLLEKLGIAEEYLTSAANFSGPGYIIQSEETSGLDGKKLLTYSEFHPYLFSQHEKSPHLEFETYNKAVDEFFSKQGSQKIELKTLQQEKQALKKLDNVRKDHEKRVNALQLEQDAAKRKAHLIEVNSALVDRAILIVMSALANQIDWSEIWSLVQEAKVQGDIVAGAITGLKLHENKITLKLSEPDQAFEDDDSEEEEEAMANPLLVDVDLSLTAYANARKYYDHRRGAAAKERKTVESSGKALKSAEHKTKQVLKEGRRTAEIRKARKTFWFEKFLWFVTSENYLVIGGRDGQQNELIVKRYLRPGDVYVHADLHGASSVIVKNHVTGAPPIPPKTLTEAGTMAICNSVAWDSKVITSAWWVHHNQVSKTAPSGEYLSTGSFMIRGKKNYLPPCHLIYGFSLLFKLEESSVLRHKDDRCVRNVDDDAAEQEAEMNDAAKEAEEVDLEAVINEDAIADDDVVDDEDADEENQTDVKEEPKEEAERDDETQEEMAETVRMADEVKDETKEASEDVEFPDTSISLKHIAGGRFELARSSSQVEAETVYLGDDKPVAMGDKASGKARMSAKAKKLQKRLAKRSQSTMEEALHDVTAHDPRQIDSAPCSAPPSAATSRQGSQQQEAPLNRGQRRRRKKQKEKYKDQDDEERELKMELLASARPQKEEKQKKSKSKQKQQQKREQRKTETPKPVILESSELSVAAGTDAEKEALNNALNEKKTNVEQNDDEVEDLPAMDDLTSLTGQPVPEDELLFAVPVVAPYCALTNYKFKVKLTPGTTKRGKAVKLATHCFTQDRTASAREKDLIKSLKDVDMSRNLPGKVKVSAPNLQKVKKK